MLNPEENHVEITTAKHLIMNDHDYCSPNKRVTQQQQQRLPQQSDQSVNSLLLQQQQNQTIQSKLSAVACGASTSSLPDQGKAGSSHASVSKISKTYSNDDLSDSSSSSSSLSSSVSSSKELIIAQDTSITSKGKPISPKDTPSVSKRGYNKSQMQVEVHTDGALRESGRMRAKRARQSTSVTDKSEWIMGDEQIDSIISEHLDEEPRMKRSKACSIDDSAFDNYISSDNSSSDVESGQESDYNSDDDPDKLWCICRKPHENKFMICCDICKDWFHGHCVNVTKMMGDRFEKQGKEWFCADCQDKLRSGILRAAIPQRVSGKGQKRKKVAEAPVPGKRGRGRPRKSETISQESSARISQRNTRKSCSSLDPRMGVDNSRLKKNLARLDARTFDEKAKLKMLIRERKKAFFHKKKLQDQQKAAKRDELGLGRQPLTANLSDGLDSLATSTSSPNMNNLPINIKSEHKERPKPNIVLQINTKKDPCPDPNNPNPRLVTAIVRPAKRSKHSEHIDPVVSELFTAEPIQISKIKPEPSTSGGSAQVSGDAISGPNCDATVRRRSNSGGSSSKTDQVEQATPRKKRKDSESSAHNGSSTPAGSKHIAEKIKDSLEVRSKQIKDLEVAPSMFEQLAVEIEAQLNECFKQGSQKYLNKYRSLIFNLKDRKNEGLVRNVLTGEISPARLVRMSHDEMASHELAKWRERENKHSIELIKRDAQLAAQQVIVKKTHKGEEVITAPSINEPDDPTAEMANQEPPTTPIKLSTKEPRADGSQITSSPQAFGQRTTGPLKMRITGLTSDPSLKAATSSDRTPPKANIIEDRSPFLDTTKDHKNNTFDGDRESRVSGANSSNKQEPEIDKSTIEEQEAPQPDQPKRFRVSIETKLDPANLSRLREPLIKPILPPSNESGGGYSPSRSPSADKTYDNGGRDEEDEDPYDPEALPTSTTDLNYEPPKIAEINEPCWSGTVTMLDVAKFSALAKPVSGTLDFMRDQISQSMTICGRIAVDQVQGYIKKLKSTSKNQILVVQMFPSTPADKQNFDSLFDYLYSRNRYGVVQTPPNVLKDFYLLPIHEKSSIPDMLKPIKGPGIDRKEPNCLLGVLVRAKGFSPSSSNPNSNYTPTPIK